jgi:hypothetical protein
MKRDTLVEQILVQWADELSTKLGRSKEQILQRGLSVPDFPSNEELNLAFPDGSSAHFRFAFYVSDAQRRQIAVFTEHCGYHVFSARGMVVERIIREWFEEN